MNQLFDSMYGKDALKYLYSKDKGTTIQEFDDPRNLSQYDHNIWEVNCETSCVTATNNDGSSKVAKSLKPQLDMSCQQSEEPPSLLDPKPDKNVPAVSVSNSQSLPVDCPRVVPVVEYSSSSHFIDLTEPTASNPVWLTTASSLTCKQLAEIPVPPVSATPVHSSNITMINLVPTVKKIPYL